MNDKPGKAAEDLTRRARVLYLTGIAGAGVFGSILMMAHLIISGNAGEISSPLIFSLYFLAASALLTLLLLVAFALLPFRLARLIAVTIAAYALVSLALDAFLPVGIGALEEGTESAPAAPLWGTLVQIGGTIALAFLIWRLPLNLSGNLGWAMVAIIAISTIVPVVQQAPPKETARPTLQPRDDAPPFNIYHVVLDSYYGPWLPWAMETLDMEPATFTDFVHYANARGNYWSTFHSYTSFMSGTMFDPEESLSAWEKSARSDSLLTDLKNAGFITHFYSLAMRQGFQSADWFHIGRHLRDEGVPTDIITVLDLWLVRAAPVGLRHELFRDGQGLVTRGMTRFGFKPGHSGRSYRSLRQFEIMLDDEKSRPATGSYVHMFVEPPHPPWELDRNGNFIMESSYSEELLLATRLMKDLVTRLDELGRLETSVIIFHADHAQYIIGSDHFADPTGRTFLAMDEATSGRIAANNLRGVNGREIEARFRPLLLVKPPAFCSQGEPLRTDDSLVELKGLRAYVRGLVTGDQPDCRFPSRDYVDIHIGSRAQLDEDGARQWVGRELANGEINVYRVHQDDRWEILPNIEFKY